MTAASRIKGFLSIVLHAHLPYIRHPECDSFLEESWLNEAITETYIPLLRVLGGLVDDAVDFRMTLSFSPVLVEMLSDGLLMERYAEYLDALILLSEREVMRTRRDRAFGPPAAMYRRRLKEIRRLFEEVFRKDLVAAFSALADSGKVELITSTATHGYLPVLIAEPVAARTQILLGSTSFERKFGRRSRGIWLPECGFTPQIDPFLKEAGIEYFFLESHGLAGLPDSGRLSMYSPLRTPAGVTAFARDPLSSRQVWSSTEGYPADPAYRDFHRDIGFDLDFEYVAPFLRHGVRTFTGLKYYRITGRTDKKRPYEAAPALRKSRVHAADFLRAKAEETASLFTVMGRPPVITASFDAELFGHWWFEGLDWLGFVLRKGAGGRYPFKLITPSEYLCRQRSAVTALPSMSSWGDKGYSSVWIDPSNNWIYRHLTRAARRMKTLARRHFTARGLLARALNQAARELLISQASDWAFMMKTGNAAAFARTTFAEHMANFRRIDKAVASGAIDRDFLSALEDKNRIFSELDFRVYAGETGRSPKGGRRLS